MQSSQRNAIILAAGTSSRFVPLSSECPKGLLEVKNEILIERQIRQLREAGISDITIVTGYKADMFEYLNHKYGVDIVFNADYNRYNNISSIIRVLDRLQNTYICSSDNYFANNVFIERSECSYYSALYAEGATDEYCMTTDSEGCITSVSVGGHDSWYMIGHVYFSAIFSSKFKEIVVREYENEPVRHGYWEDVYIRHIDELPKMRIHSYGLHDIFEFDTLDELRQFDSTYRSNTRSCIIKHIAELLGCGEENLYCFRNQSHSENELRFTFMKGSDSFEYNHSLNQLRRL